MQQTETQPGSPRAGRDELTQQLGRILHELSVLEPPDLVTLVLALPVDLAGYMQELAQRTGTALPSVYGSAALHGLWHSATENGEVAEARRIAAMIRRLSDEATWAQFVQRHPEVQGGTDHP